jgi:RNA polymerase sigma-70 factor (ECF subfamily)
MRLSPDRDAKVQPPETLLTTELLQRAKDGDARALDAIMQRYLPRLRRWASGRLPAYARSLFDTTDLVQETLLRVLTGLDHIEVHGGRFQDYVRRAVLNRVRDQIRWAKRRKGSEEISEELPDASPSPLEHAIGAELLDRYERALGALDEGDRQLLHLRIELDFEYAEIAAMTDRPSPDAARMAFQRALARLTEAMDRDRPA